MTDAARNHERALALHSIWAHMDGDLIHRGCLAKFGLDEGELIDLVDAPELRPWIPPVLMSNPAHEDSELRYHSGNLSRYLRKTSSQHFLASGHRCFECGESVFSDKLTATLELAATSKVNRARSLARGETKWGVASETLVLGDEEEGIEFFVATPRSGWICYGYLATERVVEVSMSAWLEFVKKIEACVDWKEALSELIGEAS